MFRSTRYRSLLFRYLLLSLFILSIIKIPSICYSDFHRRSIEDSSTVFLDDIQRTKNQESSSPLDIVTNRAAIEAYRQDVEQMNDKQLMLNSHLFSASTTRYILLVQVHTRVVYLRKFIEMLQGVETINQTLVIFSHDFIDSNINTLVTSITFVPVIQIFYPFSQQLYPDEFPGLDPNDCPRDIPRHQALERRCNNAAHPDGYGHYREASIVQIKHHWWWKLNFVFNSIEILQNRTDYLLLLLEEDFYLSPDALVFLRRMEASKEQICPDCLFYTLGNLEQTGKQFSKLHSKVSIADWHARYNLGMTISHTAWILLVKYAEEFCHIDDYNWDWTLVYLVQQRFKLSRVMWSSASRVTHLGSCGTHHKSTCSNESNIARWIETEQFYRENQQYLFPTGSLSLHLRDEKKRLLQNLNGGWADPRDRQLCLSFVFKDAKNISSMVISI